MAFKQYTKCIPPADFSSRSEFITAVSVLAGAPALMIAAAMLNPACIVIALEITALAASVAYYHNWLYSRLICLGDDDVHCLGMIVSISPPESNLLDKDTDYSINLLLQNTEFGPPSTLPPDTILAALQPPAEQSMPFGNLIAPQPGITAIGRKTPGHLATDKETGNNAAVMHAEFEGDGNYRMLLASKVLLALAIFALAACLLGFPGWLLALFIFVISVLVLFVTSLSGLAGEGSPSDTNTGELHTNNKQGVGADVVYVKGTWVYDPLHDGWNEIHPIKKCMKMGCWKGDWSNYDGKCDDQEPTPPNVILRLRNAFEVAQAEETIANQARPEFQWKLHPDLDGCSRDVIL